MGLAGPRVTCNTVFLLNRWVKILTVTAGGWGDGDGGECFKQHTQYRLNMTKRRKKFTEILCFSLCILVSPGVPVEFKQSNPAGKKKKETNQPHGSTVTQ